MTFRTLRCWRLYSWMRLHWTSNIVLGSTLARLSVSHISISLRLLVSLIIWTAVCVSESSANLSNARSSDSNFDSHESPILLLISSVSDGLATASHRRGVTPLVTLVNLSG